MNLKERRPLLWIEDDVYYREAMADALHDDGFDVHFASDAEQALRALKNRRKSFVAVILDVRLPPGKLDALGTRGGFETGLALARWIRTNKPTTPIIVLTATRSSDVMRTLETSAGVVLRKDNCSPEDLVRAVRVVLGDRPKTSLRVFIVHGHDDGVCRELKDFLQNRLGLPDPTILREQPQQGLTILEKFESEAKRSNLVFVLLTPDDRGQARHERKPRRRARQNVIFELGYFMGRLGRQSGRVVVLRKGNLDLPSDIEGLGSIDISNGVQTVGDHIRREVEQWL
jgi:CheY-like chemotaxis protein